MVPAKISDADAEKPFIKTATDLSVNFLEADFASNVSSQAWESTRTVGSPVGTK